MKKKSWEIDIPKEVIDNERPSEIVKVFTVVLKQKFTPKGVNYTVSANDNGELLGGFDLTCLKSNLGVIITDLNLKPIKIKKTGLLNRNFINITGKISDKGVVTLNIEPPCDFYIHYIYLLKENIILKDYVREDVGFNLSGVFDIGTDSVYVVSDVYRDLKKEDVFNNTASLSSFLRYVSRELRKVDFDHSHNRLYYLKDDVDDLFKKVSKIDHFHDEKDINNLDKYSREEIDKLLTSYSKNGHRHDDWYLLKSEVHTMLKTKANTVHSHFWADIDKRQSRLSDLADVLGYSGNETKLLSVSKDGKGTEWVSIPSKAVDISVNSIKFTGLLKKMVNTVQDALKIIDSVVNDVKISSVSVYSSKKIEEILQTVSKKKHSHTEFYTKKDLTSLLERKSDKAVFFKPNNLVLFSNQGDFLDSGVTLNDFSKFDHTHAFKNIEDRNYSLLENCPVDDNLYGKDEADFVDVKDKLFIYSEEDNKYKKITLDNCMPYGSYFQLFSKDEIVCFGPEWADFKTAFSGRTDYLYTGLYKIEFSFMYSTIEHCKVQMVSDGSVKEFRLEGKSSDESVAFCYSSYVQINTRKQLDSYIKVKSIIGNSITLKDVTIEVIKVQP